MVQSSLVSYIQQQMSAGYSIVAIREHLINSGYQPEVVDEAVQSLYSSQRHPIHTLNKTLIISSSLIFVGLIVLTASIYLLVGSSKGTQELLDVKIEGITESPNAGDRYQFKVNLLNMGSKNRYDVRLRHELLEGGTVLNVEEETVAVETKIERITTVTLPGSLSPGSYMLRTTAMYSGQKAVASLSLRVEPKAEVKKELVA